MNIKNYKSVIIFLFLIPLSILICAFVYIFETQNKQLESKQIIIFSSNLTHSANSLIHTIQIERGLSSGFVALKDTDSTKKEKLLKQQKITDKFYAQFKHMVQNKQKQIFLNKLIQDKKILLEVDNEMQKIKSLRDGVFSHTVGFDDVIKYYSNINAKLLNVIHNFAIFDTKNNYEAILIYDIETLKENLGLQRAYIYNQLLCQKYNKIKKTKELSTIQNTQRNILLLDSTPKIQELYNNFIDKDSIDEIKSFKEDFFSKKLKQEDAQRWFRLSTNFIDRYEALSINISDIYIKNIEQKYNNAQHLLYLTVSLFVFSTILLFVVFYILNKILLRCKE